MMSLTICLIEEDNRIIEEIEDENLLTRCLPDKTDPSFYCLKYIDTYGDTVFNHLQMDDFIKELDVMASEQGNPELTDLLNRVKGLAIRCKEEVHLYIKIFGD